MFTVCQCASYGYSSQYREQEISKMNKIVVADSSCINQNETLIGINICQYDKSEKLTCPVLFEESAVGKRYSYNALEE